MSAFLAAAFAFPTVVFTVLLIAFLVYALMIAIGLVDLDSLDTLFGLDGAEGALDSATNGPFDTALNVLGVRGVPLTVFGSLALIFAWLISFFATAVVGDRGLLAGSLIGVGALAAGSGVGALVARRLREFFVTPLAQGRSDLVGRTCTIRSLRVDGESGTAELHDGGPGFIAEVRCSLANELTRGSRALVYEYDGQNGIYRVLPLEAEVPVLSSDVSPPVPGARGEVTQ